MESRISVFLSSIIDNRTKPFRALIKRDLEATKLASVWCFEKEPASPGLKDSYNNAIDRSDVFVLVAWNDISDVVQNEFERARAAGVPTLVFCVDTGCPTKTLESFLDRISRDVKWKKSSEEELPSSVAEAVKCLLIEQFKFGFREKEVRMSLQDTSPAKTGGGEPAISEEAVSKLVARVVPGRILRPIPFFDESDKKSRIALLAQAGDSWSPRRAMLLTEFAGGHRVEWEGDPLISAGSWGDPVGWFGVQDVDGDGRHEIFFAEGSHGTAAGSEAFHMYVPRSGHVFSVTIEETRDPYFRTWVEPCKELLEQTNGPYLTALESRLEEFHVMPDLTRVEETPDVVWYRENGFLKTGRVNIKRFAGRPTYGASVNAKHKAGNMEWYAFFKGPVVAYDCSTDEHFVVYGPSTMYNWPTAFASAQGYLWFGTRGDGVFQFDINKDWLAQIPAGWLKEVTDVTSLRFDGLSLIVNGSHKFKAPW
jgi:hypothetical protein